MTITLCLLKNFGEKGKEEKGKVRNDKINFPCLFKRERKGEEEKKTFSLKIFPLLEKFCNQHKCNGTNPYKILPSKSLHSNFVIQTKESISHQIPQFSFLLILSTKTKS